MLQHSPEPAEENPFSANLSGYWQLIFTVPEPQVESFSDWWMEHGALSVSMEESLAADGVEHPIFGEPVQQLSAVPSMMNDENRALWPLCRVLVLMDRAEPWEVGAINALASFSPDASLLPQSLAITLSRVESIDPENWLKKSHDLCEPVILNKIAIIASWHRPDEVLAPFVNHAKTLIPIHLDPGQAFGSGSHPTTCLILSWLEQQDLRGKTVIDYGCGSGILAIAAAKLGADMVTATDLDPIAVEVCRENTIKNQLSEHIKCLHSSHFTRQDTHQECACQSDAYDIVLANILLQPLISLQPVFNMMVNTKGYLVMTGLLEEQAQTLIAHYTPKRWIKHMHKNFRVMAVQEGWALVGNVPKV